MHASGIRAHELLTLARPSEQPPDDRRAQSRLTGTAAEGMKFAGREGVVYTVVGKGGLVREVLLPHRLAERLEARRLDRPERIVDRGVRYVRRYDVGGGNAFSASFSRASRLAFSTSRSAHGAEALFRTPDYSGFAPGVGGSRALQLIVSVIIRGRSGRPTGRRRAGSVPAGCPKAMS